MKLILAIAVGALFGAFAFATTFGVGLDWQPELFVVELNHGRPAMRPPELNANPFSVIPDELAIYVMLYLFVTVCVFISWLTTKLSARNMMLLTLFLAAFAGAFVLAAYGLAVVVSRGFAGLLGLDDQRIHLLAIAHTALSALTGAAIGATAGAIIERGTPRKDKRDGNATGDEVDF